MDSAFSTTGCFRGPRRAVRRRPVPDAERLAPRFEDLGSLIVSGGNRRWRGTIRRPQVLGSISHFKEGWVGTHNLKAGGEIDPNTSDR